jgi:3-oxoacyl-[acyl-carrier protein] reductase
VSTDLRNEIALITGAGRGIGRATALRLAREGCALALIARSEAELYAVAAEAASTATRTLVLPADVTDDAQVEASLRRAATELGPISILVNNAGWAPPRRPVAKANRAEWDRVTATCLRAPMVLTHLLLPDMLARRHGAIVNIASIAARRPRAGEAAYAAAKAGLVAFTQALFAEVRDHGVKAVAICPGYVDTDFIPANRRVDRSRFLRPEDVAEMIVHVLTCDLRACPTELVLEPQFDPEKP